MIELQINLVQQLHVTIYKWNQQILFSQIDSIYLQNS